MLAPSGLFCTVCFVLLITLRGSGPDPCALSLKRTGLPRFEPAPCLFDVKGIRSASVTCGYVVVAERGYVERTSKEIHLPVLHLCPTRGVKKELLMANRDGPVVYLHGGPGMSHLINGIRGKMGIFEVAVDIAARVSRNVILYDQRGSFLSKPEVPVCTTFAFTDECIRNLTSAGVDITTFNSHVFASDLDDVHIVFGAEMINLNGHSYGATLASRYALDFPKRVGSMLLTGPVSVEHGAFEINSPMAFETVMAEMISDCEREPECFTKFPRLRKFYDALLSNVHSHKPVDFPIPVLEEEKAFWGSQYEFTPLRVIQIYAVSKAHDPYFIFSQVMLWSVYLKSLEKYSQEGQYLAGILSSVERTAFEKTDRTHLTVNLAVKCYDYRQFYTDENEQAVNAGFRSRDAVLFRTPEQMREACAGLPHIDPSTYPGSPNHSIPALIMVGTYDATTPVALARKINGMMKNAKLVIFRKKGHAILEKEIPCAIETYIKFLNNPAGANFQEPPCALEKSGFPKQVVICLLLLGVAVIPWLRR